MQESIHYLYCLRKRSFTKYLIPSELGSRHSRKCTPEVVSTTQKLNIRNGSERFLKEAKNLPVRCADQYKRDQYIEALHTRSQL